MHDVTLFFTPIRMSAELGFPDRVYGLGADIFFLTYVLFKISGVILVERWSVRKWDRTHHGHLGTRHQNQSG
jgi:MFS transporter, ACS family, tartrate transporter